MRARHAIPVTFLGLVATGVVVGTGAPPAYAVPQGTVVVDAELLEVASPHAGAFQLSVVEGFVVAGLHHPGSAVRVSWFGRFGGGFVESSPTCFQDNPATVYCELAGLDAYVLRTSDFVDTIQVDVPLDGAVDARGGNDRVEAVGTGADEIVGGAGTDTVGFPGRGFMAISLDDQANDGAISSSSLNGATSIEHDNVHADVEILNGTDQVDVFMGSSAATTFHGNGGNDRFILGPGAGDVVSGGDGRDEVKYLGTSAGVSVTLDGVADDGLPGQLSNIAADVEDLTGTPYGDTLVGTAADNRLDGFSGGVDVLRGLGGNDLLDGDQVSATLDGGEGDDVLRSGFHGGSTISGGAGTDAVDYDAASAGVTVSLDGIRNDGNGTSLVQGVENIEGSKYADTLTGSNAANVIDGGWNSHPAGADHDTISGQGGNDAFVAYHSGNDSYAGGGGIDVADYSHMNLDVVVSLDDVANDFPGQSNVRSDVESVLGGTGHDTITGSAARNDLRGGYGNDRLSGGGGSDLLDGGTLADEISGGDGVDQVSYVSRTAPVKVTLDGAPGDGESGEGDNVATDVENVIGGSAGDELIGSAAANRLVGGLGSDRIAGGPGKDVIDLGEGSDVFLANTFSDGSDDVVGGPGADVANYAGRSAPLTITLDNSAGDGEQFEGDNVHSDIETVVGGGAADSLVAGTMPAGLQGRGGPDTLTGATAADVLVGGDGDDVLRGNGGNDDLVGSNGIDAADGGDGQDRCVAETLVMCEL